MSKWRPRLVSPLQRCELGELIVDEVGNPELPTTLQPETRSITNINGS